MKILILLYGYALVFAMAVALPLLIGDTAIAAEAIAGTNAVLKLLPAGGQPYAIRRGFATPGDGGAAFYTPSSNACSLNFGAGDEGSQIKAADGGCWILSPQYPLDPMIWGAASNPVTLYVSATGSDASGNNYCLSPDTPCGTINHGYSQLIKFNPNNGTRVLKIGAGLFNENLAISGAGAIVGATAFLSAGSSVPMDVIQGAGGVGCLGAGPGCTIIKNVGKIGGNSFCYAVLVHNGGVVGLKNIALEADGTPGTCWQSDLYVERGATVYIIADVELLAANGPLLEEEDEAKVYVNPGDPTRCNLTLAGNSMKGNGINVSDGSYFWSDSEICFTGNPVFGGGYLFYGDNNSKFKFFGNPAFTSGAKLTGARFGLFSNSSAHIYFPPTIWPGSLGTLAGGSRYEGPDALVCVGGIRGCNNTTAPTGLGTGGSAGSPQGDGYSAAITLTTGSTSTAATGVIGFGFPLYQLKNASCSANLAAGTGSWERGATASVVSGFAGSKGINVQWSNGDPARPTPLPGGKTLSVLLNCQSSI